MQSNITVFCSTRIISSIGIDGKRINRSKVSLDGSELLLIYQVEKPGFEFSNLSCSGGNTHSFLSTTKRINRSKVSLD